MTSSNYDDASTTNYCIPIEILTSPYSAASNSRYDSCSNIETLLENLSDHMIESYSLIVDFKKA